MSTRLSTQRQHQIDALTQQIGRGLATKTVLFHATLASKLGLSATDLKCLDLIRNAETPVTATELADRTGLTGGAITGVVDRLEAGGFVNRVRDRADRRRWELHAIDAKRQDILDLFAYLRSSIAGFCTEFTDAELGTIATFLQHLGDALENANQQLRANDTTTSRAGRI